MARRRLTYIQNTALADELSRHAIVRSNSNAGRTARSPFIPHADCVIQPIAESAPIEHPACPMPKPSAAWPTPMIAIGAVIKPRRCS